MTTTRKPIIHDWDGSVVARARGDQTQEPPKAVKGSRFTCEAKADSADIHVYGTIGQDFWGDGVDPTAFVKTLAGLDVAEVRVWVNSPGGDAFGGMAMLNAMRRHPARITVTVDGLAASAASFIAMGGDELVMSRSSTLMIHDASGLCWGNAADMADMQVMLDKVSDNIAEVYAEKAGGEVGTWREAMRAETWYTAEEAVAAGLADRVDTSRKASATAAFDLSVFRHPPAAVAAHVPPAEPGSTPTHEGADMSDTLLDGLRTRLGINAEISDEATVLAALDEALTERAAPPAPEAKAAPEGTVVMDASAVEELRAQAAAGVAAAEAAAEAHREQVVSNAVQTGKIPPARKDHWLNLLVLDAGTETVIEAMPENVVPVVATGYTGGVDEAATDEDPLYLKAWGAPAVTSKEN